MMSDDDDDQMIFGDLRDLKLPDICLTGEEFFELYGKIEAVVRNCLLRLSGQLVEVAGTPPLFLISLFTLNTLAFFVLR